MEHPCMLIALLLAFPICFYLVRKVWRIILIFVDHVALLSRAFGGLSGETLPISVFVFKLDRLNQAAFEEQLGFLQEHGGEAWGGRKFRQSLIKTYTRVVIMRRPTDGSLQGLMYIGKERGELSGREYTLLKVGPYVVNKEYQRNPIPLLLLIFEVLSELILHPTRSLYFIGRCITYKSYLSGLSKTNLFYPRYDMKTPDFEAKLIHRYATAVQEPDDSYNPDTFVLETEQNRISTEFSFITKEDLKNPHIQFFVEQNPGWQRGHRLIGIGQFTPWQIILLIHRTLDIMRTRKNAGCVGRGAKRAVERNLRRVLNRSYSFQSEQAKKHVLEFHGISNGKVVDRRRLSSRSVLDSVSEESDFDYET